MSNSKKINLKIIYNNLIKKENYSIEDHLLITYLLEDRKKSAHFLEFLVKKEKLKENTKQEKIESSENILKDRKEEIALLEKIKIPSIRINVISEVINSLILKNPNNFDNYEYVLIKALVRHNERCTNLIKSRTKKVFFKKTDICPIYSFKNTPYKKDFKTLYHVLKQQAYILKDLEQYIIWTENRSVNGLTIHRDRIKYKKINDYAIKVQSEISREKFIAFFKPIQ